MSSRYRNKKKSTGKKGFSEASVSMQDLKNRLLFVVFGILIFRVGAHITVPGLDLALLKELFYAHRGGMLGMYNLFSGGALSRMSLFALGVMPYISSSIVMQLLSVSLPHLQQMKKEGERGQRKINQLTRYGTLGIAGLQSFGIASWLVSQHVVVHVAPLFFVSTIMTLSTGTLFLMWLGEQMTERGLGNGVSLIIVSGILSRFPQALGDILSQVHQGQMQGVFLVFLVAVVGLVTAGVVCFERAQRRIKIHYAKRQQGNKLYGGKSSFLPLKINISGVIPPIFASALILLPSTIAKFLGGHGLIGQWLTTFSFMLSSPLHPLHVIVFVSAIFFFAFLYTAMLFNPDETADNLKRSGAFLPGIRPGKSTSSYIDKVMGRLTLVGACYLSMIAMLPQFLVATWHVPFFFGGTSLLIVVVVVMDFMTQIQSRIMASKYGSLCCKACRLTCTLTACATSTRPCDGITTHGAYSNHGVIVCCIHNNSSYRHG